MLLDFLKVLVCRLFAQCVNDAGHKDNKDLSRRLAVVERDLAYERYYRARDTFGV